MKPVLLLAITIALLGVNSKAQRIPPRSIQEYKEVASLLVKYYNDYNIAGMTELFDDENYIDSSTRNALYNDFGEIEWHRFMKIDTGDVDTKGHVMAYFKAKCSKKYWDGKVQAFAISLDEHNKISGMRFMTKSKYTDKMMKKY